MVGYEIVNGISLNTEEIQFFFSSCILRRMHCLVTPLKKSYEANKMLDLIHTCAMEPQNIPFVEESNAAVRLSFDLE